MSKITIEHTSNPAIIKFVASKMLTESSYEYNSIDDAKNSTLVQQLFHLPFVKKVFISANFIALEKFDILEWSEVEKELLEILEAYLEQNNSVFAEDSKEQIIEVYAESTPNPNVQKFVTNKLLSNQNIELSKIEDAHEVPLAYELFEFPFVKEVFISDNYVSIQKTNDLEWFEINNTLRDFLKEYLQSDRRIVSESYRSVPQAGSVNKEVFKTTDDEISKQIIAVLEEYIKPAVAGDGGNIQFLSYEVETKEVNVLLQGACNGCPSSTITLKNGIEATLKQLLPGKIGAVNALN
ncbi:NifU family protein [Lutimonas zeaxanthinifaciens]|uniref:NifU family protein n=1 Tax=Lutimonas zeaxanthinifaciens TaxID=3060215 RepID=UPI00265CA90F|nr:NifU family protein [Lutimonas sp. YSD2104]WKK65470.1 NifU family protein [Lutimonas sp. YSD2104]